MNLTLLFFPEDLKFSSISHYLPLICEARREKIARLCYEPDQVTSLLAGLLLRSCICSDLALPFEELEFTTNEYHRLELPSVEHYHFSLSHSHGGIAFASDHSSIGIDIEAHRKISYAISRRFFTANEQALIDCSKDPICDFYKIWTRKEAYVKRLGCGFHKAIDSFDVLLPPLCDQLYSTQLSSPCTPSMSYSLSVCQTFDPVSGPDPVSPSILSLEDLFEITSSLI